MTDEGREAGPSLRRLFLDAAREILREPDTDLDLRKVAERAGKSRTAPYLAFGKTEEGGGLAALRLAVAAEGFRELAGRMEKACRSSLDPKEGLRAMATAYLAFARDEPRLFRLMVGPEVGRGLSRPAPEGPGRRERLRLRESRAETERVLLAAIGMEESGYLRRAGSLSPEDLAGAVWAMLHGVAMLTIDGQWEATRLGGLEGPEELAARALEFLTTASSETMRPVRDALKEAKRERARRIRARELGLYDSELTSEVRPLYASRAFDADRSFFAESRSMPSEEARSPALRRARTLIHLMDGARILWVDDRPELTACEADAFSALGAAVVRARSTEEALAELDQANFDLIVSDIARGDAADEGLEALPRLLEHAPDTPVIFYVEELRPELGTPSGAFGITKDPEELVHLVFDALERTRV